MESHVVTKEFEFPGEFGAMFAAREEIMRFLGEHGVADEEEIDILVALQEALANAVLHGCGNDPSKTVHCSVEIEPSEINFVIRDPGTGFNTSAAEDSTEDGTNLSEHGRGIFLMRSLMDELSYRRSGSELHMKKRRQPHDIGALQVG